MSSADFLVVFKLNQQSYGLPVSAVERVIRVVEITPLPKSPDVLMGVINIESRTLPADCVRQNRILIAEPMTMSDGRRLERDYIPIRVGSESGGHI